MDVGVHMNVDVLFVLALLTNAPKLKLDGGGMKYTGTAQVGP